MKSDIYDCFIFNDELDMLETRFAELDGVIDRFVLVEGNRNFANRFKPLHFQNNLPRFAKYLHKVSHVMVDDYPSDHPMEMENHQRNCMMRALNGCADNDAIIMSDIDEIPTPEAIRKYGVLQGVMTLEMEMRYYNDHIRAIKKWPFVKIAPFASFKRIRPAAFRFVQTDGIIPNAGRHLSYFGGVDRIIKKLEEFSHQEFNTPEFKSRERIQKCIDEGTDLFGRDDVTFERT